MTTPPLLEVRRATARLSAGGEGGQLVLLIEVSNQSGRTFARSTVTARLCDAQGHPLAEVQAPGGAIAPGDQALVIPIAEPVPLEAVQGVECRLECVFTTWATTVRHIAAHTEASTEAPPAATGAEATTAPAEPRGLLGSGEAAGVEEIPDEDVVVEPPSAGHSARQAPWEGGASASSPRAEARPRAEPQAEAAGETEAPWKRAARRDAEAAALRAEREARAGTLRAEQEAVRKARGPDPDDPWAMLEAGDLAAAERLFSAQRLDSAGAVRVRSLLSSAAVASVVMGCHISRWTRWSAPTVLRPLLRHADPRVREAAVAAVGVVAGPSLLNDVVPLTRDADAQVQAAAVQAVAQMRGTVTRP